MNLLSLISQILCWSGFLLIVWTAIKSPSGLWGGILWIPKLWSSAWSPIILVIAVIGTIFASITHQFFLVFIGLTSIFLGYRHIWLVNREHYLFDKTFETNWKDRIPSTLQSKFWQRRFQFIQPGSPPSIKHENIEIGKSFGTDKVILCDIHEPKAGIERTGLSIIYLHGGAWQALDKGILTGSLFNHLCNQGHLILDLAYSLAPEAQLNRMLSDVKQAIVWLKSRADKFQINTERIVLMGVSGGAHLALLTAYAPDHPAFQLIEPDTDIRVRAVISIFGINDMSVYFKEYGKSNKNQPTWSTEIKDDLLPKIHNKTRLDKWMTKNRIFPEYRYGNIPGGALLLVNLLGGTLQEIPEIYKQASPISHINADSPPTLQIYAQQDFFVSTSHGIKLDRALKLAGATSILIEVPEMVHGFDQYFGVSRRISPGGQTIMYDIERFLGLMV